MNILIIHMGGTIGMIKENDVYNIKKGNIKNQLLKNKNFNFYNSHDRLVYKGNYDSEINYKIEEIENIKDSSDASVEDYSMLAKIIAKRYDTVDGFIILHGTDTMCYAASAISFLIENITKPIIFTGSMIPLIENNTDAISNLSGSFDSFLKFPKPNVYIFFNNKLIIGNRSTKYNSDLIDAFFSFDYSFKNNLSKQTKFYYKLSSKIARITVHPYMNYEVTEYIIKNSMAVLIESYGCGNIPVKLYEIIANNNENTLIVIKSQCFNGNIKNHYEIGNKLMKLKNVINGKNIIAEAGLAKLSFLLANYSFNTAKLLFEQNLRGEQCD